MIRILSQGLFLAAFIALVVTGKIQLWMVLFLLGIIASLLWGRLYCGWVCPMNTVMRGITWLKRKLRVKDIGMPAWIKKTPVRVGFVILFIGAFAFVMVSGKQIPVLPVLLGLSALIAAVFNESMWHRYLCPQGAVLSITGRASRNGLSVSQNCVNCGVCAKACPADAIVRKECYTIEKHECIRCGTCETACKAEAIQKGGKNR